jgi:hypothetical protein
VISKAQGGVSVFLLWHSHDIGDGEMDDKLIGVYSSEAEAEAAMRRKLQFEGFRDAPEGFPIARYELDRDAWSEGYITV